MIDSLIDVEQNDAESLELYVDLSEEQVRYPPDVQEQIDFEYEMHQEAVDKLLETQKKYEEQGGIAESIVYSNLVGAEHDNVVREMEYQFDFLTKQIRSSNGEAKAAHSEIPSTSRELYRVLCRMKESAGFDVMALIGLNEVVNHLSFSAKRQPFETALIETIGESIDFQAFVNYLNNIDPELVQVASRFYLQDQRKRQRKRIKMTVEYALSFEHIDWEFLEPNDRSRLADWVKQCVFGGTGLFESFPTYRGKDKKTRYVILLTEKGEAVVDKIANSACSNVGNSYPMYAKPLQWGLHKPGGYYLMHRGQRSNLIHNSTNTIPSQIAIDSLNNLQEIKWTINQWMLDIQQRLQAQNTEIGSFRSYDKEGYEAQNPLIINPELEGIDWEDAKEDPELLLKKKKAYAVLKQAEQDESTAANKAIATARAIDMAERFRDREFFFLPWYFDNRLRQYCLVDTLNPQGSDSGKSLIRFYKGVPKSDRSYRDILVSLATTYGNGLDKMSFEERVENAKTMIPAFKMICKDPLSRIALDFWSKADEPFQFLALVKEYHDVFITNEQDKHYVSTGRDATCSGIQLAGALLRDSKTCFLVNVIPSDTVQDAYKAVADEAIKLLSDKVWLKERIEGREANRQKKAESEAKKLQKRLASGKAQLQDLRPYEPNYEFHVDLDLVDRSVAKMIVMLTPYGGRYPTMLRHVELKMRKKGSECLYIDYVILTHALIEGMNIALPGFSALNEWFKFMGKLTLESGKTSIRWITPANSLIQQEYFDDDVKEVRSAVHGVKRLRHNTHREVSDKKVTESKMQTALAANTIHSLDASVLQIALHDYKGESFTTVHDCVYGPSGVLDDLTERIRHAFQTVVRGPFLSSMLETNELNENYGLHSMLDQMMYEDDGLIESIPDSLYLFS